MCQFLSAIITRDGRRYCRTNLSFYTVSKITGERSMVLGSAWGSTVQRRRCMETFDEMDVQLTETRRRVCRAEAVLSQIRAAERCGAERFQEVN